MAEDTVGTARKSRPPVIVDIGLDVNDLSVMKPFWEQTLGYHEARGKESYSYLADPSGNGPHLFLQVVPEPRTEKNRLHLDFRPVDQTAEVERLLDLGARRADVGQGDQTWVVLADPEGNEFCVLRSLHPPIAEGAASPPQGE